MIHVFETYTEQKLHYPAISIDLLPGEKSAGIVLGKDGTLDYFLILLPEEVTSDWKGAKTWAQQQGKGFESSLPNQREQSILFGNLKEEFLCRAYWSSEHHASGSDYACYQNFGNGGQCYFRKSSYMCARAVRRISIIQ